MTSFQQQTLAKIVTGNYRTASVFEKYHLDFCCRGRRSLEDACTEKKLNIAEILAELDSITENSISPTIDYAQLSLSQLADHIVTHHHQYVKNEMPQIAMYLQKIGGKHSGRHPEMLKVFEIFMELKEEMDLHMKKEEQILFPRIRETEQLLSNENSLHFNTSYLQSPVQVMEEEHDHAGEAMAAIRQLTNNYTLPEDACTTYKLSFAALEAFEKDLHHHVHLENNILFPQSLKLFKKQLA